MVKKHRKSFQIILAALFLALASIFAVNFSIVARAEDSLSGRDQDLNFYSAGVRYNSQSEIYASTYVTNLSNRQNELMNKTDKAARYKLVFIRSEDSNLLKLAQTTRDLYWLNINDGNLIDGYSSFLEGLTNFQIIEKTKDDNLDPETNTDDSSSTTNWSQYSASFVESAETINTHYYYISVLVEIQDGRYSPATFGSDKTNIIAVSGVSYDMTCGDIIKQKLESYDDFKSIYWTAIGKNEALAYQKTLNIYFEENTTVSFNYKVMNEETGIVEDTTQEFKVNSLYRTSPKIILNIAENTVQGLTTGVLTNNGDLSMFNVVDTDAIYEEGYENITQEKILYRATGYSYEIDNVNNKFIINVEYTELDVSNYSIKFYDNNPEDGVSGAFNSYSTDIVDDGKNYVLTWNLDRIKTLMINARGWCFENAEFYVVLKNTSFVVNGELQNDGYVLYETEEKIQFLNYGEIVKIICPKDKVDKLFNSVEVEALVELQPDFYVMIEYNYVNISIESGELVETNVKAKANGQFSYMKSKNYFSSLDNMNLFLQAQGLEDGFIFNQVALKEIEGADNFCKPVIVTYGNSGRVDPTTLFPIYEARVGYDYSALFKITRTFPDKEDDLVVFKPINVLDYDADYFIGQFAADENYRVGSFSYNPDHLSVSTEENPIDRKFQIVTAINERTIISVVVNYTDEWNLAITYLQQYITDENVETPFALQNTETFSVKVKDFADVYSLTNDDLKKILPERTVEFCGVRVERANVVFDGSITYKVNLQYTHRSVRQIASDGSYDEIKVPLSSFLVWCNYFDSDWSILFLNNPVKGAPVYFKYSDSVDRTKLYGFFSLAAFEEKHSSIDSWFMTQTNSDDLKVLYKAKEVRGDKFYKFWQNNDIPILGNIFSWFGELFNSENKLVYSYFFYLDITDNFTESFISNSGAKDFYDTDPAFHNKFGCSATEGCANFAQVIVYVAIAILVLIVIGFIIKIIRWWRK